MLRNIPIRLQGFILVSVPLLCELVFVGTLGWHLNLASVQLQQVERAREFRQKTDEIVRMIYEVARDIKDVHFDESSMAGDLRELVPRLDAQLYRPLNQAEQEITDLEKITFSDDQRQAVEQIHRKIRRLEKVLSATRSALIQDDRMKLLAIQRIVEKELSSLRDTGGLFDSIDNLIRIEHVVEINYEQKFFKELPETNRKIINILVAGVIANCALALFLVIFFNRDTAGRFVLLIDNTRRLAAGKPLNPPMTGAGEIPHLDRVFNDMAQALEAARRKERAIIENALDVICSYDENGNFTAISPACVNLFGYTPDELIGKPYTSIVFADDVSDMGANVARIVQGDLRGQFESRVRRNDGAVADVLWAMQWSPVERTMFCVAHDITERKEIERMKQEFVAMVSHDLRTPLTSIQGFLTLLSTGMYGNLTETGSENLELAESSISRLIALINDLLDIEKMESGKLKMEMDDIELAGVFTNSVGALVGFAEQQGVKLKAEPTQLHAFADSDRLIQVVVNLVSNAIKFCPKQSTVTIEAVQVEDEVEVRVIDQGRGVPQEFQESIFERFQQVKASDAKVKGGSGLGLAICKAIVEGHGGRIGVRSEEGKGSTFWFRVPAKPVAISEMQTAAAST